MEIYLVGGAVRDELLGRDVKERDWVVVGSEAKTLLDQGYQQVGRDFPVFLHPETKEEYALARTERKTSEGYTGFSCFADPSVSLEDDLLRRDLTINAMAKANDGSIIDPYNGQQDLQDRCLRHISPAFKEDPLRVLRVARFAARYAYLGFHVATETLELMREMAKSGELSHLVAERVWKELEKALSEQSPQVFIQVLKDCDALSVLLPEIDALFGIPNPAKWHPEIDSGIHTLLVLEQAAKLSDNTNVRLAALLHDVGKALTPKEKWPSHHGHEKAGVPLVKQFCQRLRVPKEATTLACLVTEYHLLFHRAQELTPKTLLKLLHATTDALRRPERLQHFLLACEADSRGRPGFEDLDYPQTAYLQQALALVMAVDVKPIIEAGFEKQAIREELHRRQLQALSALKTLK